MEMLDRVVHGLDDMGALLPGVQALGARHRTYGVAPQHYDTVGSALLWTLERGLGAGYTPEVAEAWKAAYGALASAMQARPAVQASAS
jgi:hemoglobin-like flavoprotein